MNIYSPAFSLTGKGINGLLMTVLDMVQSVYLPKGAHVHGVGH